MPTKAVFFDFYNTLARYEPSAEQMQVDACRELLGASVPLSAMERAIGVADRLFYEENRRHTVSKRPPAEQNEVFYQYEATILREAGLQVTREQVLQVWGWFDVNSQRIGFTLFDDALPTLRTVKDMGIVIGLISNIPKHKLSVLDDLRLAPALDVIATPSDAGADKPDPAIFHVALAKAAPKVGSVVKPEEAVHVGDQYHIDVAGARAAGLRAVLLDRRNQLTDYNDCPRITRLSQVTEYL